MLILQMPSWRFFSGDSSAQLGCNWRRNRPSADTRRDSLYAAPSLSETYSYNRTRCHPFQLLCQCCWETSSSESHVPFPSVLVEIRPCDPRRAQIQLRRGDTCRLGTSTHVDLNSSSPS